MVYNHQTIRYTKNEPSYLHKSGSSSIGPTISPWNRWMESSKDPLCSTVLSTAVFKTTKWWSNIWRNGVHFSSHVPETCAMSQHLNNRPSCNLSPVCTHCDFILNCSVITYVRKCSLINGWCSSLRSSWCWSEVAAITTCMFFNSTYS